MNIHEYQAQELFEQYGVPCPKGKVASSKEEALSVAQEIGSSPLVVKAQVHAGGRGKGTFKNGFQGGVHVSSSAPEIAELAEKMIGQTLVTKQTGEAGKLVSKVMIGEAVSIEKEYYLAVLLDRETNAPVIVASTQGGMDIEEVAHQSPEAILRECIHPTLGLQAYNVRKLIKGLGLEKEQAKQFKGLVESLYNLFVSCDCSMVEINPMVTTTTGELLCLDAKFGFDDNALYRHPNIVAYRDLSEEDPREVEASKFDLNYIGLDGNIACLVNGAGLAMATMDIIQFSGGQPANFLDVGGGATEEQVTAAFNIIMGDPNVEGILVNIFGGIMDCEVIAKGIVAACKQTGLSLPLVVRLEGNNVKAGKEVLADSGLPIISADTLSEAALSIVKEVNNQ